MYETLSTQIKEKTNSFILLLNLTRSHSKRRISHENEFCTKSRAHLEIQHIHEPAMPH